MVETVEQSERVAIVLGKKQTVQLDELTGKDWARLLQEAISGLHLPACKDFRTPLEIIEESRMGMTTGHAPHFMHGELRTDTRLLDCGWERYVPNAISWPKEEDWYMPQTERLVVLDCTSSNRKLCMLHIVWSMREIAGKYFLRAEHVALVPLPIDELASTATGRGCLFRVLTHLHAAQKRCEEDIARQHRLMTQKRASLELMLKNISI